MVPETVVFEDGVDGCHGQRRPRRALWERSVAITEDGPRVLGLP
jgi:hypothetical protein